jgi:hypothetical protein
VSFEVGVGSVMARNPDRWGLDQNAHNLDGIAHMVIKDPTLRLRSLLNRKVDLVSDPPFADLDQIEGTPGLKLERTNEFRTIFLGLIKGASELIIAQVTERCQRPRPGSAGHVGAPLQPRQGREGGGGGLAANGARLSP